MEVFTFIFMGGDVSRITVLPIRDRTAAVEPAAQEESLPRMVDSGSFIDRSDPAVRAILDKFATFDAVEAECYLPDDKQMILGVIETGIGSVDAFNQLVRKAFANPGKAETGQKRFSMRSPSQAIVIGMERGASAGVSLGRRSSRDSGRRPSI